MYTSLRPHVHPPGLTRPVCCPCCSKRAGEHQPGCGGVGSGWAALVGDLDHRAGCAGAAGGARQRGVCPAAPAQAAQEPANVGALRGSAAARGPAPGGSAAWVMCGSRVSTLRAPSGRVWAGSKGFLGKWIPGHAGVSRHIIAAARFEPLQPRKRRALLSKATSSPLVSHFVLFN